MERSIHELTKHLRNNEYLLSDEKTEFVCRNNGTVFINYCFNLLFYDVVLVNVDNAEKISKYIKGLDLGYNKISDISPLAKLASLEKLNLEFNEM